MFEQFTSKDLMGGMSESRRRIEELAAQGETVEFSPTVILGLLTEVDCFKAIKEMGDAKFYLKDQLKQEIAKPLPNPAVKDKIMQAINQVHKNQLIVINDICKRFHVIHPTLQAPTDEMLDHYTQYWDWYSDQHLKVYGSRPDIPKEFLKKKEEKPNPSSK